jgi:hemerythrin-like domain-containing protein
MIQINPKGAAPVSPEQPLDHLTACHRRIENRLAVLERAGEHFQDRPTEALEAIESSLRFFAISGRLHTEDEESSLFPRMRDRVSPDDVKYLDLLEEQHRVVDLLWAELLSIVDQLRHQITVDRIAWYRTLVKELLARYTEHIESEDTVLSDIARRTLDATDLAEIGAEMRARRQKA